MPREEPQRLQLEGVRGLAARTADPGGGEAGSLPRFELGTKRVVDRRREG